MKRARAILISCAIVACGAEASAQATLFRYPLQNCGSTCATVTAYYDRDTSSGSRDWNCGSQTYNSHRGTDFAPFGGFTAQDQGRTIVAAADGTVMTTHDGETDRCTTGTCGGGGGFGNYVVVQHSDGKLSYYAHMRRGSLRVMPGQRVRCGEPLGLVGSSGNSTGPHVHFEVRIGSSPTDSFEARSSCGGGATHWVTQGVYRNLPAEACASSAPMDSGVIVDASSPPDSSASDSAVARDVVVDVTSLLDASADTSVAPPDASSVDANRADVVAAADARADASAYNPNDWGGCNCRTQPSPRPRVPYALALVTTAITLARRTRRDQSGRFAQQRKPVE
jgi:murein DD-endopeptidase MepM/ murein hydrolase activator NlpD